MKKTSAAMAVIMLLGVSCDQPHVPHFQVQEPAANPSLERKKWLMQEMASYVEKRTGHTQAYGRERGIASGREQGGELPGRLEERQRQTAAITLSFARRTDFHRARRLASLCYNATLGTPFMPIDIAEIALAETGSHGLSGTKASRKGALGVWQLMPSRAISHGYAPKEMENDRKCADAAVRELTGKLAMARGNLTRAKKLYCGIGREADAYDIKRRQFRKEILGNLGALQPRQDGNVFGIAAPPHQIQAKLLD
jgi:hypothetical protein